MENETTKIEQDAGVGGQVAPLVSGDLNEENIIKALKEIKKQHGNNVKLGFKPTTCSIILRR